jgi:hypothetical protein
MEALVMTTRFAISSLAVVAAGLLLVGLSTPARAETEASTSTAGPSAADRALEEFLRQAEVVEDVLVGEGITEPHKLTLRRGDTERHAVFKDIDVELEGMVRTNRFEQEFTDRYAYEVAAYRLDRYLGLGLVPVTVVREVNGKPGSVQLWIEDHITLTESLEEQRPVNDFDLLVQRLTVMWVFDALIANIDRNYGNVLVDLQQDSFYLIDHSRAFRSSGKIPKLEEGKGVPIPPSLATRLEALDVEELKELLRDLLSPDQIRAIAVRRDRLLKALAKHDLLPS